MAGSPEPWAEWNPPPRPGPPPDITFPGWPGQPSPPNPPPGYPPGLPPRRPPRRRGIDPLPPVGPGLQEEIAEALARRRTMLVGPEVDGTVVADVAARLDHLSDRDSGSDVEIRLISVAGGGHDLLALHDTIAGAPVPVRILVGGLTGPGAAVVLAAVSRDRRAGQPSARISLEALRLDQGRLAPEAAATEADALEDRTIELLALATGRPADEVREAVKSKRIIAAADAVDWGLLGAVQG